MNQDERIERLELDVDTRLLELWRLIDVLEDEDWTLDLHSQFMRAAYVRGYNDALEEDVRGRLHREHGYDVPRKRKGYR